jgi:anhydro-N-acetylmuramic acid kinase
LGFFDSTRIHMPSNLYIGLMSGTSMDGVDGVLVDFSPVNAVLMVRAHAYQALESDLARELLALNTQGGNELHRAALAANALVRVYAGVVRALLQQSGVAASQVQAVGAHGQTVRHQPQKFDATGYTLQLNNPALLAELCGIDVVADFRSRAVAAGGQGAPLVPAFHRAVFGDSRFTVAVLNIGGFSNLTVLHADGGTEGFDCGPGNALMDLWIQRHTKQKFDKSGAWAATGHVIPDLSTRLEADAYFAQLPPKSTGRDMFNAAWLDAHLQNHKEARPVDVQATLADLTARVCAQDVLRHAPECDQLLVCGGGALNRHLMQRLERHLPDTGVTTTDTEGLPAMQVEATAFAWLAQAFVHRRPIQLAGNRVLGALYPAG